MSNADRDVLIIQRLNKSFNQYPQTSEMMMPDVDLTVPPLQIRLNPGI